MKYLMKTGLDASLLAIYSRRVIRIGSAGWHWGGNGRGMTGVYQPLWLTGVRSDVAWRVARGLRPAAQCQQIETVVVGSMDRRHGGWLEWREARLFVVLDHHAVWPVFCPVDCCPGDVLLLWSCLLVTLCCWLVSWWRRVVLLVSLFYVLKVTSDLSWWFSY